jgi:hypothetical protein
MDNGVRKEANIIDFSKAFDLFTHDRLLRKTAASRVDPRLVVWIREFLLDSTKRVSVGRQISKEVRVTSGVPQGSVPGPILFLAYVNDIGRNTESTVRLFVDDCRKLLRNNDVENLQTDLNRLGKWTFENEMIIN